MLLSPSLLHQASIFRATKRCSRVSCALLDYMLSGGSFGPLLFKQNPTLIVFVLFSSVLEVTRFDCSTYLDRFSVA